MKKSKFKPVRVGSFILLCLYIVFLCPLQLLHDHNVVIVQQAPVICNFANDDESWHDCGHEAHIETGKKECGLCDHKCITPHVTVHAFIFVAGFLHTSAYLNKEYPLVSIAALLTRGRGPPSC